MHIERVLLSEAAAQISRPAPGHAHCIYAQRACMPLRQQFGYRQLHLQGRTHVRITPNASHYALNALEKGHGTSGSLIRKHRRM